MQQSAYVLLTYWNKCIEKWRLKENKLYHTVGMPPSMQRAGDAHLPAARRLEQCLRMNHDAIVAEVVQLITKTGYCGFPMADIDEKQGAAFQGSARNWRPLWVKFMDTWAGTAASLPILSAITRAMGDDVLLLHVSVFWPPTELPEHIGISGGVYRFHYGLLIPEGDCGMRIDGVPFKWREREGVLWDDMLPHSSWNRTGEARLIIFADMPRGLPWFLNWCNRRVHGWIQRTKHVKSIQAKLAAQGVVVD